jgi:hypothetical protein
MKALWHWCVNVVKFAVLAKVTVKIIMFSYVTPCSLVDRYQSLGETCRLHSQGFLADYTAPRPKRLTLLCL